MGYSLNETVVVLDRIREMMRKYKRMPTDELLDMSVNAVIPRTIMTASTVLLALLSLVLFGGHVIQSFSLAMTFGIFRLHLFRDLHLLADADLSRAS